VVLIIPHVVQIVVLPAGADALLRVAGAAQPAERRLRRRRAEEDGLELVHPGRARRPPRVGLGLEELGERLADPPGQPLWRCRRRRRGGGGGTVGRGGEQVDDGGQNPSGG
jgi:hypothetical protein